MTANTAIETKSILLRPRYSLLTLLVLTAVIAGGVKLWHGPHHVVVRPDAEAEVEYTYTREWSTERIFQGPRIVRVINADGSGRYSLLCFYRQGKFVPQSICLLYHNLYRRALPLRLPAALNLDSAEQQEYEQTIDQEMQRYRAQGISAVRLSWKTDDITPYQYRFYLN